VSLCSTLNRHLQGWARANFPELAGADWALPCQNPKFGHFQTNIAMVAGKKFGHNPRELAARLIADFAAHSDLLPAEAAGPGFVNFRFTNEAILAAFQALAQDPACGIAPAAAPRTIAVDFSGPNVAKEMHVGHIRSTVLGDTLSRILEALGHRVIRDNHIGDWGTQFGIILLGYKKAGQPSLEGSDAILEIEKLYQETNRACDAEPGLREQAKQELVKLQNGDAENLALWKKFVDVSMLACGVIYQRLGVRFDHTLGESFFNPWLREVVDDLKARGIARESEGAIVVFFDGNKELADHPLLVQKSDGAALYATTDLATIRYRVREWKTDTIVYVTDGRQQLHFKQIFATTALWGQQVGLEHVWFGAILGENKKPLKTREGADVKLRQLLDEAEERAKAILKEKRPELADDRAADMARVIGLGAIKYADQCQNRNLDYVFDWNKLLAFDGNTAPYLLNAYVRTRSILRKMGSPAAGTLAFEHELDFELARKCFEFSDILELTAREFRPHHLCAYLYELASTYHRFFENCPVGQASSEQLKNSRLLLCKVSGDVLRRGLNLLGIETLEEM
jgi:arginyl-tRNA synthetase